MVQRVLFYSCAALIGIGIAGVILLLLLVNLLMY